jgi:centractin
MPSLCRSGAVTLASSAELEVCRELKEGACYVAKDLVAEEAAVRGGAFSGKQEFRLPDGQRVALGAERFRAPEALFRPSAMGLECPGVATALAAAALGADISLRRPLLGNVVLAGGSTLFRGFGERLLEGTRSALPAGCDCKVKVWAPAERRSLTWIGGSILASLGTFRSMWVTRAQWKEHGANLFRNSTI